MNTLSSCEEIISYHIWYDIGSNKDIDFTRNYVLLKIDTGYTDCIQAARVTWKSFDADAR